MAIVLHHRHASLRNQQPPRKLSFSHVVTSVIGLTTIWPLAGCLYLWQKTSQNIVKSSLSSHTKTTTILQLSKQQQHFVVFDKSTSLVASNNATTATLIEPPLLPRPRPLLQNVPRKHVISYEGIPGLDLLAGSIWFGNHVCESIADFRELQTNKRMRPVTVVVNVTFGCLDYYQHSSIGSGNVVLALYMVRASLALLGNVELHFVCHDAYETRSQLVLPWFTGTWYYGASITRKNRTLQEEACAPFWGAVLDHVYRDMQADLRRMAHGLLRVNGSSGGGTTATAASTVRVLAAVAAVAAAPSLPSSPKFVPHLPNEPPLYKNIDILDDAVIHFRCGDLLDSDLAGYGFWTFDGYVRHISSAARRIGILTQPFAENNRTHLQQRYLDNADAIQNGRCKTLALALQDYIQERHPLATVSIHNNAQETIALSTARLVLANQSIGGRSTFSVFPIVATYGTGYYLQPQSLTPCSWLGRLDTHLLLDPDTRRQSVILFDEPHQKIGSHVSRLWDTNGTEAVLDWFRS
jgi:hypothetical protein